MWDLWDCRRLEDEEPPHAMPPSEDDEESNGWGWATLSRKLPDGKPAEKGEILIGTMSLGIMPCRQLNATECGQYHE